MAAAPKTGLENLSLSDSSLGHEKLLCAAIDFGTTFSGYAFSLRDEYIRDPLKISTNQKWIAGSGNLVSMKTASCILLDSEQRFLAFGFEAEDKYAELIDCDDDEDDDEKEHLDYYFFQKFKMTLFNDKNKTKTLNRQSTIEDVSGKRLPAEMIFKMAIEYIKNHLLGNLQRQAVGLGIDDIHWVITVPAIWEDFAKQFMREAAVKAGIPSGNLTMALEPEAASLYCQLIPCETKLDLDRRRSVRISDSGTTYMVADLGGGTTDVTVHQKMKDGSLREQHEASGGPWGGTSIDQEYFDFLGKLVGTKTMNRFKSKRLADYIEMGRDFELKKRTITPDTEGVVTLKMPVALRETFADCSNTKTIKEAIAQTEYANDIKWTQDKMRVKADIIKNLFKSTIDNIVNHVDNLLKTVQKVDMILMVGGFSECALVEAAMRARFCPKYKIINPDEAGLAVLKGAVLFGHKPRAISSRVAKFTYGYEAWPVFRPGIHPEDKKVTMHGVDCCKDVFQVYMQKGTEIKSGDVIESMHRPVSDEQDDMAIRMFISPERCPKFVTDSNVRSLGTLTMPLPPAKSGSSRKIKGKLKFGETELIFEAEDQETGKIHTAKLECL